LSRDTKARRRNRDLRKLLPILCEADGLEPERMKQMLMDEHESDDILEGIRHDMPETMLACVRMHDGGVNPNLLLKLDDTSLPKVLAPFTDKSKALMEPLVVVFRMKGAGWWAVADIATPRTTSGTVMRLDHREIMTHIWAMPLETMVETWSGI
jgi:hypothetical protein